MPNLEFMLEALVAILLIVTVVYCYILNRRLVALRGAQTEMMQLTTDLSQAMQMAQAGISDLRRAGDEIGADLQEQVTRAQALSDELRVMTQSGEDLANRLEHGLVGRQDRATAGDNSERHKPAAPESELERELREAIGRSR